jgi:hypothetical protein
MRYDRSVVISTLYVKGYRSFPMSNDLPLSPTSSVIYHTLDGKEIDDAHLDRCTRLFSNIYGIWGQKSGPKQGCSLRPGLQTSPTVCSSSVLVVCYERR